MTDGRRSRWIASDVDLLASSMGEGLLDQFGAAGVGVWHAFTLACKRGLVPGQIRVRDDADALAQLGMAGCRLHDNDGNEWQLEALWTYLGHMKHVRRTRSARGTKIEWTRFADLEHDVKRQKEREKKARSRAMNSGDIDGTESGHATLDSDRDRDSDKTEVLAPTARVEKVELVPMSTAVPEAKKERPRDPVWDALIEVCGVDAKTIPVSKRGAYGKAVKELKGVDATPDEIRRRGANYVRRWGADKLTPSALVSHWAEVAQAPTNGVARTTTDVQAWLDKTTGANR